MKRILTSVVMGVILIAACALTAVIVAKNRTLSVGIRAATSGMGDASVSELGDVEPYPVIEFAEKHAYDLGGQAYLWFYGRWRMILEERDFVLKNGAKINSLLKYRDPPTADDEIYVTPNLDVLNIVSFFDLAEQPQLDLRHRSRLMPPPPRNPPPQTPVKKTPQKTPTAPQKPHHLEDSRGGVQGGGSPPWGWRW